jgi:hypothetical protein
VKYIDAQCFQLLQLLIYQSRHLGNDLGQVTGTELQMCSVGSFVNIGQKRLRMSNQLRNKSSLSSAHPVSEKIEESLDQAELFEDIAAS